MIAWQQSIVTLGAPDWPATLDEALGNKTEKGMTFDEKKILAAAANAGDYAERALEAMTTDELAAALAGRSLAGLRRELEFEYYLHAE